MTALSLQGDLWLDQMPLIRDLVLDLPQGHWSCLLGPSGIGKSSLARVIAGLPGPQRLIGRLTTDDGLPVGLPCWHRVGSFCPGPIWCRM